MAAWNIGKARSHTNIDYLGVLDYLDNTRELPYKNPETAGLDALGKERLLGIKARGQAAVAEMKKMAELCKEKYGLDRCEPVAQTLFRQACGFCHTLKREHRMKPAKLTLIKTLAIFLQNIKFTTVH